MNRDRVKQHARTLVPFVLAGVLLVVITGPFVLLAFPLQRWASRHIWDARDRWDTIWCFALFGLLTYLPLIVWRVQLIDAWQQVAFLGSATFSSWRVRFVFFLFLFSSAARFTESDPPPA